MQLFKTSQRTKYLAIRLSMEFTIKAVKILRGKIGFEMPQNKALCRIILASVFEGMEGTWLQAP